MRVQRSRYNSRTTLFLSSRHERGRACIRIHVHLVIQLFDVILRPTAELFSFDVTCHPLLHTHLPDPHVSQQAEIPAPARAAQPTREMPRKKSTPASGLIAGEQGGYQRRRMTREVRQSRPTPCPPCNPPLPPPPPHHQLMSSYSVANLLVSFDIAPVICCFSF